VKKSCLFKVSSVLMLSGFIVVSTLNAQQVLENPSDEERLYTNLSDEKGVTSNLFVTKGKAYIQDGKVAFGTGKHRLQNVDGRGQLIGIAPSQLVVFTMDKTWALGFRVDEMRFHWDIDESRAKEVAIFVDELKVHDKTVASVVSKKQQECVSKNIALKDNQIILSAVSDIPFAPGRTYVIDRVASTSPREGLVQDAPQKAKNIPELTIKKDGTLASQDIMIHLTSPINGEPETLLMNTTLMNQYKDRLMFLEIRGIAGGRTALLYFDEGQSIDFDEGGVPVSGKGKFRLEAVKPEGQLLVGWLSPPSSPHHGKKVKSVNLEFVSTGKAIPQLDLTELVEVPVVADEKAVEKPNK
jgi:hypothetical protein